MNRCKTQADSNFQGRDFQVPGFARRKTDFKECLGIDRTLSRIGHIHAPPGVCRGLLEGVFFGGIDQPAGFFMLGFYLKKFNFFCSPIFFVLLYWSRTSQTIAKTMQKSKNMSKN